MGLFNKIFGLSKKNQPGADKVGQINLNDLWYTTPTISNEFPQTTDVINETEFDIHILDDDYRQNEFLNLSSTPLIEQEVAAIKNIWNNFSKKSDNYTLFKNCHVRQTIGTPNLHINLTELKSLLNINKAGVARINDKSLIDSFAFSTEDTTYYGIVSNDTVSELCIAKWNDNTINEIHQINKAYNSVFVSWYNCDIIKEND